MALRPGSDPRLHKCESRYLSILLLRGCPETTNFVLYPQDRGVFTEGMYVIAHSRAPSHSLRNGFRNNCISGRSVVKYPLAQGKPHLPLSSRERVTRVTAEREPRKLLKFQTSALGANEFRAQTGFTLLQRVLVVHWTCEP